MGTKHPLPLRLSQAQTQRDHRYMSLDLGEGKGLHGYLPFDSKI